MGINSPRQLSSFSSQRSLVTIIELSIKIKSTHLMKDITLTVTKECKE